MSRKTTPNPGRLLVVDDNKVNRLLLGRNLELQGHTVCFAENGRQALEMVRSQPFDIILLDIQMPEMDGLEAIRQICTRWPSGDRPRIIAMTANAMQGDREQCLEAGMDDYLSKPIRVEELVAALVRSASIIEVDLED